MTDQLETAALVTLLRQRRRAWQRYADLIEQAGSAVAVLEQECGLFAGEQLADVQAQIDRWRAQGIRVLSVLDPAYPDNLRGVHDRPPLIFVAGELERRDARSVAVVGARTPSPGGVAATRAIAECLVDRAYTVVSGLAAGIDTAAHTAALMRAGRTVAVIGNGLNRCYPPQNAALQRTIAANGAILSQFWPHVPPGRRTFPMRNAVMSGLALATVIVEASYTSGTRVQARRSLAQGRPVLLLASLLTQEWARELASSPGVHVVGEPSEIVTVVDSLSAEVLAV